MPTEVSDEHEYEVIERIDCMMHITSTEGRD